VRYTLRQQTLGWTSAWSFHLPLRFSETIPKCAFKKVVTRPGSIHDHYSFSKPSEDRSRCTFKKNKSDFYSSIDLIYYYLWTSNMPIFLVTWYASLSTSSLMDTAIMELYGAGSHSQGRDTAITPGGGPIPSLQQDVSTWQYSTRHPIPSILILICRVSSSFPGYFGTLHGTIGVENR
jgi:hypothetical protein